MKRIGFYLLILLNMFLLYNCGNNSLSTTTSFLTTINQLTTTTDLTTTNIQTTDLTTTSTQTTEESTTTKLELIGDNEITINEGDEYVDEGVIYMIDNTLQPMENIIKTGNVDTNTCGDYVITYSVSEYNLSIKRTVHVKGFFKDPNLEQAVKQQTGINNRALTQDDLSGMTYLHAGYMNIEDLTGIENLVNLQSLHLNSNKLTDISPISNLTNLLVLDISYNHISNLSPLEDLTNLQYLAAWNNQISDLSPLTELHNLTQIDIFFNQITDLSPLSSMTQLNDLWLSDNQITDLTPLQGLSNLNKLILDSNQIMDISSLQNLIKLTTLYLSDNQISDISVLNDLPDINLILLKDNPIDLDTDQTAKQIIESYINNNVMCDLNGHLMDDDYSNNASSSNVIDVGSFVNGEIDYPFDKDTFKFTLTESTHIYFYGLAPDMIKIELENSSFTQLKKVDYSTSKDFDINLNPGTYYIIVSSEVVSQLTDYVFGIKVYQEPQTVTFSDPNLEQAVRNALNIPIAPLTDRDVQYLTKLSIENGNINDLTGIEALTGLRELDLINNEITDISQLNLLYNLKIVNLLGNPLDLSQPANLNAYNELLNDSVTIDINFGNSIDNASEIDMNSINFVNANFQNDREYYRFTLNQDMNISITTINYVFFRVYDNEFHQIDTQLSQTDGQYDVTKSQLSLTSGTYYIIVNPYYEEPYHIILENQDDPISVTFSNTDVENLVRKEINLYDRPLLLDDIVLITNLYVPTQSISDLSEIDQLLNLNYLNLSNNRITDITPLENLVYLNTVYLANNPIDLSQGSDNYSVISYFINHKIQCDLNGQLIEDDFSDVFNEATPINLDITNSGNIDYSLDIDYFKFTLTEKMELNLSTSNDIEFYLYDENHSILLTSYSSPYLSFEFEPGDYYLLIQGYHDYFIGGYQFKIQSTPIIIFNDANLSAAIQTALNNEPSTIDNLKIITELDLENKNISDLSGIEYLTNLSDLNLQNNKISDISKLDSLTQLKDIYLEGNPLDVINNQTNKNVIDDFISHNIVCDLNGLLIDDDYTDIENQADEVSMDTLINGNIDYQYDKDIFEINLKHDALVNINSSTTNVTFIIEDVNNHVFKSGNYQAMESINLNKGSYYIVIKADDLCSYEFSISKREEFDSSSSNFLNAVNHILGTNIIYLDETQGITDLDLNNNNISSLSGIEYFTDLTDLNLQNNHIHDISPLSELTQLNVVLLSQNPIDIDENASTINYLISLSVTSDITGAYIPDDAGDTEATAKAIPLNTHQTGSLDYLYDIDYYKFVIPYDAKVYLSTAENIYFYLYDENGNVTDPLLNFSLPLTKGTYYIKISDKEGSSRENYQFTLDSDLYIFPDTNLENALRNALSIPTGPINQEVIDNNQDNISDLNLSNQSISDLTALDQLHISRLDLQNNNITDISLLENIPSLKSVYLSGNPIDFSNDSANYAVLQYFIAHNINCDVTGIYVDDDYPDTFEDAYDISNSSQVKGYNDYYNDIDDFMFTLDDTYTLDFDTGGYFLYCNLYNDTFNQIAYFDYMNNFEITLQKGTYYLKASGGLENYIINIHRYTKEVNFQDTSLEQAVRGEINRPNGTIYIEDLASITKLDGENLNITNLSGIEQLTNLTELNLANNNLSDISLLSTLTNLQKLYLENNQITDILSLSTLTNLQELNLENNKIADISALGTMINLSVLNLTTNLVTDISPLSSLIYLEYVNLLGNPITLVNESDNYNVIMNFINSNIQCDLNGYFINDDYCDIFEDAVLIDVPSTITGILDYYSDLDISKLTLDSPTYLAVMTTDPVDIELYDINKKLLGTVNGYSEFPLNAGTYYLVVKPMNYFTPDEDFYIPINYNMTLQIVDINF